jgi:type III secretion system low calcium response chaperone LcrH/SycD
MANKRISKLGMDFGMHDDLSEFRLSAKAKAKLKNMKLLKKELAEGRTAQEIMGFSDETMSKFYKAAYLLFEHKRYSDAANAFLFLATLNPYNHDYWLGLGMCTQMCHEYEAAIDAYELAALCDISSPVPYFYLAKCLFAIHDRESALQALDLAIETADELADYAELKEQAQKAKDILLKNEG